MINRDSRVTERLSDFSDPPQMFQVSCHAFTGPGIFNVKLIIGLLYV